MRCHFCPLAAERVKKFVGVVDVVEAVVGAVGAGFVIQLLELL
jgi:hypothetical protein